MPWRAIAPMALVGAALGLLFGAAEVATVAFAESEGNQGAAGFLLALWALGSLTAGVVTGTIAWRKSPLVRLRWGALGMLAAVAPLPWISSISVMGVVFVIGGLAIAPTLIATMSLAEAVLPPARLTEGMAYIQTGLMAGIAPGAALAGLLIEEYSASSAYLVSLTAGVLALGGALATRMPPPASVSNHEQVDRRSDHLA